MYTNTVFSVAHLAVKIANGQCANSETVYVQHTHLTMVLVRPKHVM
jgi:hypothetical protein